MRKLDREDLILIIIFTRHWIHYGTLFLVLALSLTAAVEGVFVR